ncbi:MAG: ATP synthase F1 subunit gamma [Candidatus Omnitrophica bacterium]|nr:ATP synthase F1 subunit gamma [Candidatus Omnitrophota bacterium]
MASLRQIRSSLRSVKNTKQIMRAMQLVSASKLKRAQGRLMQARMVLEFLDGLLERVLETAGHPERQRGTVTPGLDHPLCARREGAESAVVIFTSDTGLCGSYNTNLLHLADAHLRRDSARPTHLVYIGKKGHRYFTKRGFPAAESFLDLAGRPDPAKAEAIGRSLIQRFLSGQVGSVDLIYSRFMSSMTYQPTIQRWLPVEVSPQSTVHSPQQEYIFEPSPERVFGDLLPRWALAKFQLILLEAFTSEHSARMIAMKNATDNAEKLITDLTMQRNKIRQASITKEISEIVGTAEALK